MSAGNGTRQKQRLELTWIGKDERPRLEPRILLEDKGLTHYAKTRGDADIFDNILIQGDNLLALKALEQEYAGRVKCIFIDPPYNTGSAFEHYDDGIEHSLWLSLIRVRLELLSRLLSPEGSLWITIDDEEAHYLKVLCDEVFGRKCFLADVAWEKADSPRSDAKFFSVRHDHLLVYAKNPELMTFNRLLQSNAPDHYNKRDEAGNLYYLLPLRSRGADGYRERRPSMFFPIRAPDGTDVYPKNPDGSDSRWQWGAQKVSEEKERIEFIKTDKGWSVYFRVYFDSEAGRPPETIWPHTEVGSNRTSKKEIKELFGSDVFATPKPEALIQRVLRISTNPGDITLDSFAGSGTTGAVAHKMGRRWIMIEQGEHCRTHIAPRLTKVIDGADAGGITEAVGWGGGGGFRFYRLAPSLIEYDRFGQAVISSKYDANMLSAAMCKHMGFTYAPSQKAQEYWNHGYSSERDFIFVTTASLTYDALKALSEDVGDNRTLLICCKAFNVKADTFPNLTIKKIPQTVLKNCEWGHDDYSLKITRPSEADPDDEPSTGGSGDEPTPRPQKRRGNGRTELRMDATGEPAVETRVQAKRSRKRQAPKADQPAAARSKAKAGAVKPKANASAAKAAPKKSAAETSGQTKAKANKGKPAAANGSQRRGGADNRQGRLL